MHVSYSVVLPQYVDHQYNAASTAFMAIHGSVVAMVVWLHMSSVVSGVISHANTLCWWRQFNEESNVCLAATVVLCGIQQGDTV